MGTRDAAGTTIFTPHELPTPGECTNVGMKIPDDGEFKMCGPGTWTLSRMSCDNHEYKSVTIEHPKTAFTADVCKVYMTKFWQVYPPSEAKTPFVTNEDASDMDLRVSASSLDDKMCFLPVGSEIRGCAD